MNNIETFVKDNRGVDGLEFIKRLLVFEKKRIDENFCAGSVFEEINENFGIFPSVPLYPVYFHGNIENPKDKIVFIGINPGYKKGVDDITHSEISGDFFKWENEGFLNFAKNFRRYLTPNRNFEREVLMPYFRNMASFLRKTGMVNDEVIDYKWFHNNLLNLELIPYYSENSNGLRINDVKKYRETYFEILLKMLRYINPQKPIFIVGFPTFKEYLKNEVFKDVMQFQEYAGVCLGKIDKFDFIGLPFLTRVNGGLDNLISKIKKENIIL